ncbi:MAG TPA: hypothetical protein VJP79_07440 [Nitrososphaera sp.]|nr:hypothetical protein [Nitrososphaera sp.]
MDNLRQLLVAIAAFTLLFSAVSGANPNYFAGFSAFAEDGDDNDHGNSDRQEHEDLEDDSDEYSVEATFGEHSRVELQIDDEVEDDNDDNNANSVEAELEVETEDGDLSDGEHAVSLTCDAPDLDMDFDDALVVQDGDGEFKADLALVNGTSYQGCMVAIGDETVDLQDFMVIASAEEADGDDEDDRATDRGNGRGAGDDDDEDESDHEERGRGHERRTHIEAEDSGIELEVEMDTNMTDGTYDVQFTCDEPDVNMTIEDSLTVEDGEAKFKAEIDLADGTYSGCKIASGGEEISSFDDFTVAQDGDDDDVEEKRKEKRKEIVSRINAPEEHRRRINANPASTGDYMPGWIYVINATGIASRHIDDDADREDELSESMVNSTASNSTSTTTNSTNTMLEVMGDSTVDVSINMGVWKSNTALVLLNVLNGTIEVDDETYTVELGYALYSVSHNAMRIGAFVSDDDGNIYKLKLRGTADEDAEFPMTSGDSIDLVFEGNSGPARNSFSQWDLDLEGSIEIV